MIKIAPSLRQYSAAELADLARRGLAAFQHGVLVPTVAGGTAPPLANTFEGGADETTITTGNSGGGSGDAFDSVVIGASVGLVFDTARAAHGSMSLRMTQPATTAISYVAWSTLGAITGATFIRWYQYMTALPSTDNFWPLNLVSSGGNVGRVRINQTTGFVELRDSTGAGISGIGDVAVAVNQWVRIECRVIPGTGGSAELAFRLYNTPDSTSIDDTVALTGLSTLGTDLDAVRLGAHGTDLGDPSVSVWFDDFAISTDDWIGPAAEASGPSQRFMWLP